MIEVKVRDRGMGLSGDMLDKIFQPFYTTRRDGLGMGLAICRSIIEAHGGRLWAENNPGRGATFCFTVPVEGGGVSGTRQTLRNKHNNIRRLIVTRGAKYDPVE